MKLGCWWFERQVTRRFMLTDVGEQRITGHLETCERCRRLAADYAQIHSGLSSVLQPQPVVDTLVADVFRRIDSADASRRPQTAWRLRTALSLAFAGAMALCLFWPFNRDLWESAESVIPAPTHAGPARAQIAAAGRDRTVKTAPAGAVEKPRIRRKASVRIKRRIRARRIQRLAAADSRSIPPAASAAPLKQAAAQTNAQQRPAWHEVGYWYEVNGYQGAALTAYEHAYEDNPSPDLAYHTGRMAESTGDISTAIDYYSRALEPSPSADTKEEQPQKGSTTCIEPRPSV